MTDQHQGDGRLCVLCPVRYPATDDNLNPTRRIPEHPQVCQACRSWLLGTLRDIKDLADELATPLGMEIGSKPYRIGDIDHGTPMFDQAGRPIYRDPLAARLPVGPTRDTHQGSRVAGTPEASAPISLTARDLLTPLRPGQRDWVTDRWHDQYGSHPAAVMLGSWVQNWRQYRQRRESHPANGKPVEAATLAKWIENRLDWACDEFEYIADFATELHELRGALRGPLHIVDVPEYMLGVPCRGCGRRELFRPACSDWIECRNCPELLSPDEYHRWVGLLAEAERHRRGYRTVAAALAAIERGQLVTEDPQVAPACRDQP